MRWLARNWLHIALMLAIAAAVHVASVFYLPDFIMIRVMAGMARAGGVNTMLHGVRATSASRAVVRPSPDLLYSTCAYDLDKAGGRLRVHASAMPHTYWSVSAFDARTNNFFVLDDRQAGRDAFDITLAGPGAAARPGDVRAPTARGVILLRTLIDDDAHLSKFDAARRGARCEPAG
jgi:uncharacterized membrane protein